MSIMDAIRNEITGTSKYSFTNVKPIDKILLTVIGTVGMGAIGLIAAVGLYKMPPLSSLSASKGFNNGRKMVKGLKLLWDTVEPIIRRWKPELKEQFYYVDQTFDFIQGFMDQKEIGSLFQGSDEFNRL
jgi:hypothetical protein